MKWQRVFFFLRGCVAGVIGLFAFFMVLASMVEMKSSFMGGVAYGFWILFVWAVLDYGYNRHPGFFKKNEIWLLLALCLVVHLFFLKLLPTLGRNELGQGWDYRRALASLLSGKICYVHKARHVYWCNYEILLSSMAAVFGGSLELGQIVNACSRVIVLLPLFALSERIAGRRLARLVVLLIMFSPALIMVSMLLTGEFLSSMFMFLAFYFAVSMFGGKSWYMVLLPALFGGVMLGLSELFKSITILFVIAFLVAICLYAHLVHDKRVLFKIIVGGMMIVFVSRVTSSLGGDCFASLATAPELIQSRKNSSDLLYELVLGLNLETDGTYNDKLAVMMRKMDTDQQWKQLKSMVTRDWRKYPKLMVRKFARIHGSHNTGVGAVTHFTAYFRKVQKNGKGYHWYVPKWVAPLADYGTMVFEFFFALGAIGLLMSLRNVSTASFPGIFAALLVMGFAVIEQLIEGYGRYKISIYPFYFMVIPYVRVWFEKDSPFYVRIGRFIQRIRERKILDER